MIIESICVGPFEVNCYILGDDLTKKAVIIDPGADYKRIKVILETNRLSPLFIINTHGHIDHIGADDKFGIPIYIHRKDVDLIKDPHLNLSEFLCSSFKINSQISPIDDNQDIYVDGKIHFKVIHTPGHTPGSICLLLMNTKNKILFSGDTLFYEGIGRTDFPEASCELLIDSIKKRLFVLDDDTIIYPGHGPISSIGHEKKTNPFLMDTAS